MGFSRGENPNHPKKGASIKVDPIRDLNAITLIKQHLLSEGQLRNHCLFTMGINTAWRANELLALRLGHVRGLKTWDDLTFKQSKTNKYRITPINPTVSKSLETWLNAYDKVDSDQAPLFPSRLGGKLTVPTLCNMVKKWCALIGLPGNYGSHSLRKTWGFHQRMIWNSPVPLLMKAYGHSSEEQTLDYLGIQPREVADLYRHEL